MALATPVLAAALLSGCAGAPLKYTETRTPDPELAQKILALDPEHISEADVRDVLSKAPAPHVLNIHGGIYPVHLSMISFAEFLIRMGYPEQAVRNPKDGAFSYSCYFDARKIAGAVAWHYEHEAMRPMIVGHSQGGIQTMKVLHDLAGKLTKSVKVWNPRTGKTEERDTIKDPFTGQQVPVVGLQVSYATVVGAGGLTRLLPNQWVMNAGLRSVPDSAVEFTGFRVEGDFLGGDLMGAPGLNAYTANGQAAVRNVGLPFGTDHVTVPNTKHLALNAATREWIGAYHPIENPRPGKQLKGPAANLLWAADVWYSVKKNWCLELQHLVRNRPSQPETNVEQKSDEGVGGPGVRRRVLGRRVPSRAAN